MQNTGESEQASTEKAAPKLMMSFWQSFLLTLSGAAGLISMVASGPSWLTYSSCGLTIALLIWVIADRARQAK